MLHFAWEWLQCGPFFVHLQTAPTLAGMVQATLGDVVFTGVAYLVAAVATGRWTWCLGHWTWRVWVALLGTALVLSVGYELLALELGRHAYTARNPRIPGTSVSALPVAQLLLLFPSSFALAGLLVRWLLEGRHHGT